MPLKNILLNQVALISSHGGIFLSNNKLFQNANAEFIFVGCNKDPLASQAFVSQKKITHNHRSCNGSVEHFLTHPEIIEDLPEFVLFENDDQMFQIANSSLPLATKIRLLPIKNPDFIDLAGSKVGLARISKLLEIPHPESVIVENLSAAPSMNYPFISKADRYGGGQYVRLVNGNDDYDNFKKLVTTSFVNQKLVEGEFFSAEGFYRDGKLIFANFSQMLALINKTGPSAKRLVLGYVPSQVLKTMEKLGSVLALNGMVNSSYVKDVESGEYLLFEFDVRANSWSHFAIERGFDPINYFSKLPIQQTIHTDINPNYIEAVDIRRWAQYLSFEPGNLRILQISIELKKFKRNGGFIISSYPVITAKSFYFYYFSDLIFNNLQKVFRRLPISIRYRFRELGITQKIARIFHR